MRINDDSVNQQEIWTETGGASVHLNQPVVGLAVHVAFEPLLEEFKMETKEALKVIFPYCTCVYFIR